MKFLVPVTVPDDDYDSGWDGNLQVPTKNAIYDKIETFTGNSFVLNETPSGSINSSNAVFTAATDYVGGSLEVYLNGLKQRLTTDYAETSPAAGTFTFTTAPVTGDSVVIDYQAEASSSSLNADTVDGIHASASATANKLLALDSNAKFPISAIATDSGAWVSWSPSYASITVGNGTVTARYTQIGKTVHFRWTIVCGSTTALGNDITFTIPVTAHSFYGTANVRSPIGLVRGYDVGTLNASGSVMLNASTTVASVLWPNATDPRDDGIFPWTEASGDTLSFSGTYEAA